MKYLIRTEELHKFEDYDVLHYSTNSVFAIIETESVPTSYEKIMTDDEIEIIIQTEDWVFGL